MSYSQFDDVLSVVSTGANGATLSPGHLWLEVKGPLGIDPTVKYEMPIVISWTIIQSPADGSRDPALAARTSGLVKVTDPKADAWSEIVQLDLVKFREGPARAVGVAVLQQVERFGYETITWCDHVQIKLT